MSLRSLIPNKSVYFILQSNCPTWDHNIYHGVWTLRNRAAWKMVTLHDILAGDKRQQCLLPASCSCVSHEGGLMSWTGVPYTMYSRLYTHGFVFLNHEKSNVHVIQTRTQLFNSFNFIINLILLFKIHIPTIYQQSYTINWYVLRQD